MKVPSNWNTFKMNGIDSSIEGIITDTKDTIIVEIGKNVVKFNEVIIVNSIKERLRLDSIGWSKKALDEMKFSSEPKIDELQSIFLNEYYLYDTLDGKKSKFMLPKKIGDGLIGLYVDDVKEDTRLSIYSKNLDTLQHFALYKAFLSIQFK
jgi:hypothetical protein